MPQSTLSARRVFALLPKAPSAEELTELLFQSKAELADLTDDALRLEVTADRLDLLSEGGLALHLAGALGAARGLPAVHPARGLPAVALHRAPSVAPLRPVIAGLLVDAPEGAPLDEGLLTEAVRFQELLHATLGRDRRLASLGIYPLERFTPPLRYALEPVASVEFVPLDGEGPVRGPEFFERHPLAARYGEFGRRGPDCLTLRDARGEVLSLPPILNARTTGEARVGDRRLLLESTGTLAGRVQDALALLALVFIARGWRVAPAPVEGVPPEEDPGRALLAPRSIPLRSATVRAIAGEGLSASDVEHALARSRLSARSAPGGWSVEVPAWRPDLLAEVDLVEDLLIARGLTAEAGVLPPSRTRGHRLPESRFRARVGELLLGLGFVPLVTTVMVPGETVRRLGRTGAVEVANPVSELYSHLRDSLLVSLVGALAHNVRHGYPQRFSEVGPVVVRDPAADAGAATRYRAAALLAGEGAGFADAAALADYLLGALGARGVREPADLPAAIPGRAARVRLAGESVAEVGELHPAILKATSVPVPVAWAEVDLSRLFPLVGRAQTP